MIPNLAEPDQSVYQSSGSALDSDFDGLFGRYSRGQRGLLEYCARISRN